MNHKPSDYALYVNHRYKCSLVGYIPVRVSVKIIYRAYVVYSGRSYYRHLQSVLIEDLVTFSQDSRSRDYGNDDAEPCT